MTIAKVVTGAIGARAYLPEGPYGTAGNFPLPGFGFGDVLIGDYGAEFVFCKLVVSSTYTANQGDVYIIDNSYNAQQSYLVAAGGYHQSGAQAATFYLGGQTALQTAYQPNGNVWSYTFPAVGVYGVWLQRAGNTLINIGTYGAQKYPLVTAAVYGQVNNPATATVHSQTLQGAWAYATSQTFTASTTSGSVTLTAVAPINGQTLNFVEKGQTLSGTGIATGAVVTDIQGSTITMSLAATATNSAQTITAYLGSFYCTTTNGSPVLTNVTSIAGVYPNQTVTGTGVSGTILSITGAAQGTYNITLSANASANGSSINVTTSGYYEGTFDWPYVGINN